MRFVKENIDENKNIGKLVSDWYERESNKAVTNYEISLSKGDNKTSIDKEKDKLGFRYKFVGDVIERFSGEGESIEDIINSAPDYILESLVELLDL